MPTPKKSEPRVRIYCAGPLFNRAEQAEMAAIAEALEGAGFAAFLPQRDGLLFAEVEQAFLHGGYERQESVRLVQSAVFWLDAYEVIVGCRGLVMNLNGRVPDEGAVAEAAMAWMAGKALVFYKSDSRSLIQGLDNPLLAGLGGFVRVSTVPEIAYAFAQLFRARRPVPAPALPPAVRAAVERGRRLSRALAQRTSPGDVVSTIVSLARARG